MTGIELTEELAESICEGIEQGKSLEKICRELGSPSVRTVYSWLAKGDEGEQPYKSFLQKYARAHEVHADRMMEEIIEIADNSTDDVMFITSDDGDGDGARAAIKHSAIARSRLMVDTRKWAMGKKNPKKYGERITQEIEAKIEVADASTAKSKLFGGVIPLVTGPGEDTQA